METSPWNDRPLLEPMLAKFAKVITYDRAGMGESTPPKQSRGLDELIDGLGLVLHEVNGTFSVVLVGHSIGGLVAYEFARRNPDRVCGLVLLDSSHPTAVPEIEPTV